MGTDAEVPATRIDGGREQLLRLGEEVFSVPVGGDERDRRELVIADLAHVMLSEPVGARIVIDGATRTP